MKKVILLLVVLAALLTLGWTCWFHGKIQRIEVVDGTSKFQFEYSRFKENRSVGTTGDTTMITTDRLDFHEHDGAVVVVAGNKEYHFHQCRFVVTHDGE